MHLEIADHLCMFELAPSLQHRLVQAVTEITKEGDGGQRQVGCFWR